MVKGRSRVTELKAVKTEDPDEDQPETPSASRRAPSRNVSSPKMKNKRNLNFDNESEDISPTRSNSSKSPRRSKFNKLPVKIELDPSPSVSVTVNVSPRRGRPSTIDKKPVIAVNDAQDLKDYKEFKSAKNRKDILSVYTDENALIKFFTCVMRASGGSVDCPSCKKNFGSIRGMVYHIQRCKEITTTFELLYDEFNYEDVKKRPWTWVNGSSEAKHSLISEIFKGNKTVQCLRAPDCPQKFTTVISFFEHLEQCCVPTYNQFRGSPDDFRQMSKGDKSVLIKLAMATNGQLPCLSCGKIFTHKYGLAYHVDRCGFSADRAMEIPWKCYRCGFLGKIGDREDHLENCEVPPAAVGAKNKDELIKLHKENKEDEANGGGRKRCLDKVTVSGGKIPEGSSQTFLTPCGLKRFKFRAKYETNAVTVVSDMDSYKTAVNKAQADHEMKQRKSPLCPLLVKKMKDQTMWTIAEHGPYVKSLIDKRSVGLRQRLYDDFMPLSDRSMSGRTTKPPLNEHTEMPEGIERLQAFHMKNFEASLSPPVCAAYAGGPISCVQLAPNPLSENEECLAVVMFPDDSNLIGTDGSLDNEWRQTDAYVQLWRVKKETVKEKKEEEETRCQMSLWFILRIPGHGLALSAQWMPRVRDEDDSYTTGYLAVTMSNGTVVIYGISSNRIPTSSEEEIIVVEPEPLITLQRPFDEEIIQSKRTQLEATRIDRLETFKRTPRRGKSQHSSNMPQSDTVVDMVEDTTVPIPTVCLGVDDLVDVKTIPLMKSTTTTSSSAIDDVMMNDVVVNLPTQLTVENQNTNGASLQSTPSKKKDSKKKVKKMKMAKNEDEEVSSEPLPPPPIIAIAWNPFDCNTIAAVDASGVVILWRMDELPVEESEDSYGMTSSFIRSNRFFIDIKWTSPVSGLTWVGQSHLAISFAEKLARVLDTETGVVLLEENTVKTAGRAVSACNSSFGGFFMYQSEFYPSVEAPETAVVYICYDLDKEGYFVVPLANRHHLMVWSVAIGPNGVIASAGADGRLQLTVNGRVVPRGCAVDLHVNLHSDPLLLIRNRITPSPPSSQNGDRSHEVLPPVYVTHDQVCDNMWLDVVQEDAECVSNPPLLPGLIDLRIESLNAVTVSHLPSNIASPSIVVTGGQAGILFARTSVVQPKTVQTAKWLNLSKRECTPGGGSKESTPRPRSSASKERTPKMDVDSEKKKKKR